MGRISKGIDRQKVLGVALDKIARGSRGAASHNVDHGELEIIRR